MAPKGYEIAARDLRNFGKTLETEGGDYGKQKTKAEDNKLDFTFPVIGLMYKSSFNSAEGTVVKALGAFSDDVKQTGTSLVSVADAYEERERQNAETAGKPNEQD